LTASPGVAEVLFAESCAVIGRLQEAGGLLVEEDESSGSLQLTIPRRYQQLLVQLGSPRLSVASLFAAAMICAEVMGVVGGYGVFTGIMWPCAVLVFDRDQ
jgi:hypothetical protein